MTTHGLQGSLDIIQKWGCLTAAHNLWINSRNILYCSVIEIRSSSKLYQLKTYSNDELHRIFDHSYQIEESNLSHKFHCVSGNVSKRVFNESTLWYSSLLSFNTAHSKSTWSIVNIWPIRWIQPPKLLLSSGISLVAIMMGAKDKNL